MKHIFSIHPATLFLALVSLCVLLTLPLFVLPYAYAQGEDETAIVAVSSTMDAGTDPQGVSAGLQMTGSESGAETRARTMQGLEGKRESAEKSLNDFMERVNTDGPPRAKLQAQTQEQVRQRISIVSERMNSLLNAILAVANSAEATASRIEQENSVNMNAVRTLVQEINEYAGVARADIANFSNIANMMVVSDDPSDLRVSAEGAASIVREEIAVMRGALLEAHAIIMRNATQQPLP